jgi:hypothetical protein
MNNRVNHRSVLVLIFCLILTLASASAAHAQHGDVWLSTDVPNDKIALGVVDEAGATFTPGVRALEVILTPDTLPFSPFDYSAEDPGFRSAPGELPPSQPVSLTLLSLSKWNGSGLDPVAGSDFSFDLSGGFSTEANGVLHQHPLYGLTGVVADGVYVASFNVATAGLAPSEPYYFVMLKDDLVANETDAEALTELLEDFESGGPAPVFGGKDFTFFADAYAFVAVPEPSGVLLAGVAAVGLIIGRRRR